MNEQNNIIKNCKLKKKYCQIKNNDKKRIKSDMTIKNKIKINSIKRYITKEKYKNNI